MAASETKTCQNCKKAFIIEPEDFAFYVKIKVPPPTWCPECRLRRRMVWRNDHFLFRKKDIHQKEIFSMYVPESKVNIIDTNEWAGDSWDQHASGMEYDFGKSFFEQFNSLLKMAPLPSRSIVNLTNSDYSNNATDVKNCYLVFGATYTENSMYSENLTRVQNCVDSSSIVSCEISYECFMNQKCYRAFFSSLCEDCHNITLCSDCVGCSDCFGCVALRKKSYCFFNEPCTKEEYEKKLREVITGSRTPLAKLKARFDEFRLKFPVRYAQNYRNTNVTGEYITNSRNVFHSYNINAGENLKYCQFLYSGSSKDSMDHNRFGGNTELIYECGSTGTNCARVFFCYQCYSNCSNLFYSDHCLGCSDCFGCIGLNKKKYCILNKQYSKEEYELLVPRIIQQMVETPYLDAQERVYRFGEFFPPEFSPHPYNISIAQEFFPITKEEASSLGYLWHEQDKRDYQPTKTATDIPDAIENVSDVITNEIIACSHGGVCSHQCTRAYRIVPDELSFYRQFDLPLPVLCPNCRYFERIAQRNPIHSWHRQCMCDKHHPHHTGQCPNEFETSYAPDRPEIVYCEQCYQAEVV